MLSLIRYGTNMAKFCYFYLVNIDFGVLFKVAVVLIVFLGEFAKRTLKPFSKYVTQKKSLINLLIPP